MRSQQLCQASTVGSMIRARRFERVSSAIGMSSYHGSAIGREVKTVGAAQALFTGSGCKPSFDARFWIFQ